MSAVLFLPIDFEPHPILSVSVRVASRTHFPIANSTQTSSCLFSTHFFSFALLRGEKWRSLTLLLSINQIDFFLNGEKITGWMKLCSMNRYFLFQRSVCDRMYLLFWRRKKSDAYPDRRSVRASGSRWRKWFIAYMGTRPLNVSPNFGYWCAIIVQRLTPFLSVKKRVKSWQLMSAKKWLYSYLTREKCDSHVFLCRR